MAKTAGAGSKGQLESFTLYKYQSKVDQRPEYKAQHFETTAGKNREYTGIYMYKQ
jgi:hypothetical protein